MNEIVRLLDVTFSI